MHQAQLFVWMQSRHVDLLTHELADGMLMFWPEVVAIN
jgi:hypothetical protein